LHMISIKSSTDAYMYKGLKKKHFRTSNNFVIIDAHLYIIRLS